MTNGDKVRQMTDTELLDFLIGFANCACDYCVDTPDDCNCTCGYGYKAWLESEAEK